MIAQYGENLVPRVDWAVWLPMGAGKMNISTTISEGLKDLSYVLYLSM